MGKTYSHITEEERCEICRLHACGISQAQIARRIGRANPPYKGNCGVTPRPFHGAITPYPPTAWLWPGAGAAGRGRPRPPQAARSG
ncbi:MAG TPA: hypothetical protein DDX54_00625 [Rhodospirillaceae bacterium]|nr:helix-turn-helix domain-containing protein [Alphaproteobacteria bacterium]HBH25898.1 hypothetical protein [Rhodospirillaceae bacterium]